MTSADVVRAFLSIGTTLLLMLTAWICRTLWKVTLQLARLTDAVYPPEKSSLPDQVEAVRDDVRDLRKTGSDRLQQILEEARLTRVENAQERAARRLRET